MKAPSWQDMRARPGFYLTAVVLIAALLLGGSGTRPIWTLIVELLSALLIAYFAANRAYQPARGAWLPLLIVALIAAIPLLQLVPLSWETWSALPGRQLPAEMLALAGLAGQAMPASLEPESTIDSALSLLPGVAMLVATLCLGERDRRDLVTIVVVAVVASATLGAFQYATGGQGTLFNTGHRGNPIGLFANRNHHADFLMLGLILLAAIRSGSFLKADRGRSGSTSRWLAAGLAGILAVATIATTSRMGVLLLPLAVVIAALLVVRIRSRASIMAVASALAVAAVALPVLSQNAVVSRVLDRYSSSDQDQRYGYWADTIFGIPQYLPFGAGAGTFVPVYQTVEALDHVDLGKANHAHNEYLEIALDAGLAGWAALLLFLAYLTLAAQRLAGGGARAGEIVLARAALGGIAILLLHSLVDYPLRMISIGAVMGLLCGLLLLRRPEVAEAAENKA